MTYEYACEGCGHLWETEQSINDKPLKKCPQCGKSQAKRLVSGGAGFLLKGGGWYADGYGSSGSSKSNKTESSGGSSKSNKTESSGGSDTSGGSSGSSDSSTKGKKSDQSAA